MANCHAACVRKRRASMHGRYDDAKHYQVRAVERALEESKS